MAKKPIRYCLVDAFTDSAFKGNPAAVCMLEEEKDDDWLLEVAREVNAPVTCYLTRMSEPAGSANESVAEFRLRWFTSVREVKLCGHGTLASSHFLFKYDLMSSNKNTIHFFTMSGILKAKKIPRNATFLVELDFPAIPITELCDQDSRSLLPSILKSLNLTSVNEIYETSTFEEFLLVVLPSSEVVVAVEPDFDEMRKLPGQGLILTGLAPTGSGFDFFTRFFCPKFEVLEDHVCGSAHCALANYWTKQLGKHDFIAYQASERSGVLIIHLDEKNQRVFLRGEAVAVMEGSLLV